MTSVRTMTHQRRRSEAALRRPLEGSSVIRLDRDVLSPASQTNQRPDDTARQMQSIRQVLQEATEGRVHVEETVPDLLNHHTDFILSEDSLNNTHEDAIRQTVARKLNSEVFEVVKDERYIPMRLGDHPVLVRRKKETLVIRVHAVLRVLTPLQYWLARAKLTSKLASASVCAYVLYFMLTY